MNNNTGTLWSRGQSFSDIALSRRERESEYADDIALDRAQAWIEGLTEEDCDMLYLKAAQWEYSKRAIASLILSDHEFREELFADDILD